jgi:aconitate hydratase
VEVTPTGRARGHRPRRGGHRGHHELHQHLQPLGAARRGPARAEGRRAGLTCRPAREDLLAPGSRVVTDYLRESGTLPASSSSASTSSGYGCTTCIGNSGPLPDEVVATPPSAGQPRGRRGDLGQPQLRGPRAPAGEGQLPRLAAARGGLRHRRHRRPRPHHRAPRHTAPTASPSVPEGHLAERRRGRQAVERASPRRCTRTPTRPCTRAPRSGSPSRRRRASSTPGTTPRRTSSTRPSSRPHASPEARQAHRGRAVLALLGDSVTTDHISPAGDIAATAPRALPPVARRVQGGLQLVRLAPRQRPGDGARHLRQHPPEEPPRARRRGRRHGAPPHGRAVSIYDASERYKAAGTPLIVIAGKEYGTGSSRDWAAKGTLLLGVRAVIAESFERIHRANLVGMGVLPLVFSDGENAESLGLTGRETYTSRASTTPSRRGQAHRHAPPRGRHRAALHRHRAARYPRRRPLLQERRHPADRAPQPRQCLKQSLCKVYVMNPIKHELYIF